MDAETRHKIEERRPRGINELAQDVLMQAHGMELGILITIPVLDARPGNGITYVTTGITVGEWARNNCDKGRYDLIGSRIICLLHDAAQMSREVTHPEEVRLDKLAHAEHLEMLKEAEVDTTKIVGTKALEVPV